MVVKVQNHPTNLTRQLLSIVSSSSSSSSCFLDALRHQRDGKLREDCASLLKQPSAASLSKSSGEVCARLHRDGARNPAKYSRRMDTQPDSPPAGDNANACTSRARGRDFSGQQARTGPSKLAPFPGAKRQREIQSGDEKLRGNARRAAARNER